MAPDLERLARTPWPIACCASSGTRRFNSALARSCSRNAGCVRVNAPANSAQALEALISTMRTACNARLRWLDAEEGRGFAALDTPPELPLSGDDEMLVKRIRRDLDSNPLAAAGNHRKYCSLSRDNPKVMLQLWRILFDRRFFRERPRQHELGLEDGLAPLYTAIEGGGHPAQHGMADLPLDVRDHLARIGLIPAPIKVLGHQRRAGR